MSLTFDAVVVGAGTAGASAAYHLADQGLDVALVDARGLSGAGARWVNGVPPWMFDRAGLARPKAPELRGKDVAVRLYDPRGSHCLTVDPNPVWNVDMRHLVARLHRLCFKVGVSVFEHTRVNAVELDNDRPRRLVCAIHQGPKPVEVAFEAKLFVDATGLAGILRHEVPALDRDCPDVPSKHLCSAAQQVRKVTDMEAAKTYCRSMGAGDQASITYLAVDGGFSTLVVQVDWAEREVDLLTGAIADGNHRSGVQIIEDFIKDQPWIGEALFGGEGLIPLRRSYDRLGAPGLALVGNAGCQVFPTHGSGIGSGLIAGRMLGEAAASFPDPGSAEAMAAYSRAYQRELGAVNGAYDVFRHFAQSLDRGQSITLLNSGVMAPGSTTAALAQRMAILPPSELATVLPALAANPGLAVRMLPALVGMQVVYGLYKLYPEQGWALRLWSLLVAGVYFEGADVGGT